MICLHKIYDCYLQEKIAWQYTHSGQNETEVLWTMTYLRSNFFNLLGFINGTKNFEKNPSGLISFSELGSAKGQGSIVERI